MIFVFYFVYVVYYVYLFANIVPSLHPWDESHLVMVDDLFNVLLDAVCQNFVENFSVYVHQRYWPEVFFLCYVFIWFGDQDDAGFIKSVWEPSIFLIFLFVCFNYLIVVRLQLSAFTLYHSPPPNHLHLPCPVSTPPRFVHVSFIVVPENPSTLPSIIPSHLPSDYCQIVLNFNVSG